MILLGVTQRSLRPNQFGERRDSLDVRWARFLTRCGYVPVPLPNDPHVAVGIAASLDLSGLLFTGGEDLGVSGGDSIERDETEQRLLYWALSGATPVLGVCRGMQLIVTAFGGKLGLVEGHVATRHHLTSSDGRSGRFPETVNSYHRWGVTEVEYPLVALARHGFVIEAVKHAVSDVVGIMWHPERESTMHPADIHLFRGLFGGVNL